jgi:hypothetical protein
LRNALVQPYSNGISEGFVNKIRVFKRQMHGRAHVDLLGLRLLLNVILFPAPDATESPKRGNTISLFAPDAPRAGRIPHLLAEAAS